MRAGADLLAFELEASLHALAREASGSLLVVAPFMKAARLDALLALAPIDVAVEVFTRWRPDEVAAGVSDLEVLDVCAERKAVLRLNDRLHAKLYVADGSRALVGSANLTAAGLGIARAPNLELMVPISPTAQSLALFRAALDAGSRPATAEEARMVADAAAAIAPPDRRAGPSPTPDGGWLPSFRSPDRLHGIYASLGDPDGRRDIEAVSDLGWLRMPPGLDGAEFRTTVRSRLFEVEAISDLIAFLDRPRRFGELTSWLSRVRPEATFAERQRLAQTLIRWLTFFAGGNFGIAVPSHSEVLSYRPDARSSR